MHMKQATDRQGNYHVYKLLPRPSGYYLLLRKDEPFALVPYLDEPDVDRFFPTPTTSQFLTLYDAVAAYETRVPLSLYHVPYYVLLVPTERTAQVIQWLGDPVAVAPYTRYVGPIRSEERARKVCKHYCETGEIKEIAFYE